MKKAAQKDSQLLAAGALLPPGASIDDDRHVDTVSARSYRHHALGERPVVRLVPDALAAGEDITFATLGFEAPSVVVAVAKQRRQALGFPGWALVNDPKHARFALDVMKDFRREAKRAATKPGHAKDGFDTIARELARSVPHFLPSFYEEAGRRFLEQSNAHYASQCFGKARDAELSHGLAIDEDLRKEAFVEFALAGALSIKALARYAKDLADTHDAKEAFHHYRELVVRRSLGGLPPWAGLCKEMRKLAKEAGLDSEREDERLVAELLEASAINKAPKQFWRDYEPALRTLSKTSDRMRRQLLQVIPDPPNINSGAYAATWVALLDRIGVLAEYDEMPNGKQLPPAGAWFSKLLKKSAWDTTPDGLFALLRRIAPRLKAEGVPVDFTAYNEIKLDICDLALEIGIPVKDPGEHTSIDLDYWAEAADHEDTREHPRDPTHLAADPRFAKLLQDAVGESAGNETFEKHAKGKKAMAAARKAWLLSLVDLPQTALPDLAGRLTTIASKTSLATFEEFPEALPRLQSFSVADRLARTLRGGFFGELWWPDLEATCNELMAGPGKGQLVFSGPFPFLVACDGRRAIVIGPRGRVFEHDLQLPKSGNLIYLAYLDAQLLVVYRDDKWNTKGYWSGAPKRKLEVNLPYFSDGSVEGVQVPLGDGGVVVGGAQVRAGDTQIPRLDMSFFHDGQSFWLHHWHEKSEKYRLVELDPQTGNKGRQSRPHFLEDFVAPDCDLVLGRCYLMPAPDGLSESPLGLAKGLLGQRCRMKKEGDRRQSMERIDGVRWDRPLGPEARVPDYLLSLPDGKLMAVDDDGYTDYEDLRYSMCLWDTEGVAVSRIEQDDDLMPSIPVLPPNYWHFYRPRDEKGSKALRTITDEQAENLLRTCREELASQPGTKSPDLAKTRAQLAKSIPAITDQGLRQETARVVQWAAQLATQLDEVRAQRDPENPAAKQIQAQAGDDGGETIREQLSLLMDTSYDMESFFPHLRALATFFSTGAATHPPECGAEWHDLLGPGIGAVAWLAPTVSLNDKEREAWLTLIDFWADSIFSESPECFRSRTMKVKRAQIPFALQGDEYMQWALGEYEGDRFFLPAVDPDEDEEEITVVQYSPSGAFALLPGATLKKDGRFKSGWATPDRLHAVAATVREHGARPFVREHAEALATRTGISYGEAALLICGLPRIGEWEKNFLPKVVREQMGLKVAEADVARQSLKDMDDAKRRKLFDLALPNDPQDLYVSTNAEPPAFVQKLASAYVKVFGKQKQIDVEVIMTMEKRLGSIKGAKSMLPFLTAPKKQVDLCRDAQWTMESWGDIERNDRWGNGFDDEEIAAICAYVSHIHSELPVGHLLGQKLVELVDLARARASHEGFMLRAVDIHAGNLQKNQAFVRALGGKEFRPKDVDKKEAPGRDRGDMLAFADPDGDCVYLAFRPGKVRDWVELCKLGKPEDWSYAGYHHRARAVELLLSERIHQIAQRTVNSPLAEGDYEANPLSSVPELVVEVATAHALSDEGAALYLQLLALTDPSDARLKKFNGWTPKTLKAAGQELVDAKLVVKAKRARAGRELFLPGGWEDPKHGNKPIETWKLPLFGVRRQQNGKLEIPLGIILPVRPMHILFSQAWGRTLEGDIPRYEEAKARRRR